MERDFQSKFLKEEQDSDSAYNDSSIFSDGTLQSIIPKSSYSSSSSSFSSFNFFREDFPALTQHKLLPPFTFKTPKNEPFNDPTFDFFSKPLPNLHSLELTDSSSSSSPSSSLTLKRSRVDSSILVPHSELARRRRQKISDKTRCLQKLMPWDKKMDTATMLEEAYKYVQFLQAQISALQSMPCDSGFTTVGLQQNDGRFVSGLGCLNRQQLLQVMVNSPVAQTMLYSQGFCVFSMEQLVLLNKVKEKRDALQQFLAHEPGRRS